MKTKNLSSSAYLHIAAAVCILTVCPPFVSAQAQAQEKKTKSKTKVEPNIELDTAELLQAQHVVGGNVADAVWQLEIRTGHQLIMVPIRVKPAAEAYELSTSSVRLSQARFVAWSLTGEAGAAGAAGGGRSGGIRNFGGGRGIARPGGLASPGGRGRPGNFGARGGFGGRSVERDLDAADDSFVFSDVPADAPRLTRRLTIEPDGMMKWKLDRSILSGQVNASGNNLYAFRIDQKLLREQNPAVQQRKQAKERRNQGSVRNRNRKVDPAQRRQELENKRRAQQELKARQAEYKALQKAVRDLPTEFSETAPKRIWAVFTAPQTLPKLSINVVGQPNWSLTMDEFATLRRLAGGGQGTADGDAQQDIQALVRLADRDSSPNAVRAAAHALSMSGLAAQASTAGPLFLLLQTLTRSQDVEVRRTTISAVAAVDPPTAATMNLMKVAALDTDPLIRLESVRMLLRGARQDPRQLNDALSLANRLLTDPQGPPPGKVLGVILEEAGVSSSEGFGRDGQATAGRLDKNLIAGLRFHQLKDKRLDQAISFVLAAAPDQPIAAGWLDHRLLGSPLPQVTGRTLQLLQTAGLGKSVVDPVIHRLLDAWLGPAQAPPSSGGPKVTLSGPIQITSPGHNLFNALRSSNAFIQTLAWQELRHFTFDGASASTGGGRGTRPNVRGGRGFGGRDRFNNQGNTNDAREKDTYAVLVDAALNQPETPLQAVTFLTRQSDLDRSTWALVTLAARGTPRASAASARQLAGSLRPIQQALSQVHFDDRHAFADAVYQAAGQTPPLLTPLLAHRSQTPVAAEWFGEYVSQNKRPPSRTMWTQGLAERGHEPEHYFLDVYSAADDPTLAIAAVDGLVASADGSSEQTQAIYDQMSAKKNVARPDLPAVWHKLRKQVYLEQIEAMAGAYELVLNVYGEAEQLPEANPRAPAPPGGRGMMGGRFGFGRGLGGVAQEELPDPTETFALGSVDLVVEDDKIQLGPSIKLRIPSPQPGQPARLSLRISSLSKLKNLASAELGQLNLDKVQDGLEMFVDESGVWRGNTRVPDSRIIELVMTPGN